VNQGSIRVQGWPVYEPGWRREILRTTWPETGDGDSGDEGEWLARSGES
jgi:hypothetical protein